VNRTILGTEVAGLDRELKRMALFDQSGDPRALVA
jgi:hypothetical protein